jgi:hypothetical protein
LLDENRAAPHDFWAITHLINLFMTIRNRNRFWFIAFLLLSFQLPVQFCRAQAPSGDVSFSFGGDVAPVFDLTGSLSLEQQLLGAGGQTTPLSFGIDVNHDARGHLSGSGVTLMTIGNDVVAANYVLVGTASGGGPRPNRFSITVRLTGEDVVAGVSTRFKVVVHYNLLADPGSQTLVGTARGSASFSNLASGPIKSDVTVQLPASMDGSWAANMKILALRRLAGTATIVLSSGRALPTSLTGTYSSRSAVANIQMAGINEARGTVVHLNFISSEQGTEIQFVRGKILGQSVR